MLRAILRGCVTKYHRPPIDRTYATFAIQTCGVGDQGALGLGDDEALAYELESVGLEGQSMQVAAGHFHSLSVRNGNELWAWGRNKENQVASSSGNTIFAAHKLDLPPVKQVAASGVSTGMCDQAGQVWMWGRSRFGQLGVPVSGIVHHKEPVLVNGISGAVQLALGWGHAAVITSDDDANYAMFSWGFPKHGRLGHTFGSFALPDLEPESQVTQRCILQPQRCPFPSGFSPRKVACGLDHTLVLGQDGRLVSFGDNSLGQLGRDVKSYAEADQDMEDWIVQDGSGSPLKVRSLACGLGHSMAITHDDKVMTCGWDGGAQLGHATPANAPHLMQPVHFEDHEIKDGWKPVAISAGRVHSAVILERQDDEGVLRKLFMWGSGASGRLANGSQDSEKRPFEVPVHDGVVESVALGFDHTLVVIRIDQAKGA